jgi:hypothetical protein
VQIIRATEREAARARNQAIILQESNQGTRCLRLPLRVNVKQGERGDERQSVGEQLIILKRVNNRVHRTINYSSYLYTTFGRHETRHDRHDLIPTTAWKRLPPIHPRLHNQPLTTTPPHHLTRALALPEASLRRSCDCEGNGQPSSSTPTADPTTLARTTSRSRSLSQGRH